MNKYLLPGVLAAVVFFVLSTFTIMGWPKILQTLPELPAEQANLQQLGQGMVSPDAYLLPFEVASILLLSALIGAIYIGREKQHDN